MSKGKVLVVDDEELIRTVAQKMLHFLDYETCTAKNGAEAVTLYREHFEKQNPFDLVILDWKVPNGKNGFEIMQSILQIKADAKGLLSSGVSSQSLGFDLKEKGFVGTIDKPYDLKTLKATLERVLIS